MYYRRGKSAQNALFSDQRCCTNLCNALEEYNTLVALDLDLNDGEANSDKFVSYNNYNRKCSETEVILLFN